MKQCAAVVTDDEPEVSAGLGTLRSDFGWAALLEERNFKNFNDAGMGGR
jgi:hypothetical protein